MFMWHEWKACEIITQPCKEKISTFSMFSPSDTKGNMGQLSFQTTLDPMSEGSSVPTRFCVRPSEMRNTGDKLIKT